MSEKLKKQSVIISLIWAFVGTIGVVYYIKIGTGMDVSPNYANNIIYYFIYAASAFSEPASSSASCHFISARIVVIA